MDVLHDRCAGLDIGKRDLKACVRTPSSNRRSRRQEIRTFATDDQRAGSVLTVTQSRLTVPPPPHHTSQVGCGPAAMIWTQGCG
jgi:hypothetical protein